MSKATELTAADPYDVTDAMQLAIGSRTAASIIGGEAEDADERIGDLLKSPDDDAREALVEVILDALAIHDLFEAATAQGALSDDELAGLRGVLKDHQDETLELLGLLAA